MKKILLAVLTTVMVSNLLFAQTVKNVVARAEGNQVIVTYDLVGSTEGQKFTVNLKSSKDNFASPLKEVIGDVGENISPGTGLKITWDALKEIGAFSGTITFEIGAVISFSPLQITQPVAGAGVKLGKQLNVQWKGGEAGKNLKMSLLRNTTQMVDIGNVGNSGSYTWSVPKTLEKGSNYKIKLFDPTQPNAAALSAAFRLKKTSVLVYILPGVAAAGIAAAVLGGGGGGGGGNGCTDVCNSSCSNYNPSDPSCQPPRDILPSPPPPPGGGD